MLNQTDLEGRVFKKMTVPSATDLDYRLMYHEVDYDQYYGRYTTGKYQHAKLEYLNCIKNATPAGPSSSSSSSQSVGSVSEEGSVSGICGAQTEGLVTDKPVESALMKQIVFGLVAFMCIALIPSMVALICVGVGTIPR